METDYNDRETKTKALKKAREKQDQDSTAELQTWKQPKKCRGVSIE